MANTASSRPAPRPRVVVCTACRQSKLRCIGRDVGPCERCNRLGLDCIRNASYRRVSKSRKIAELEQQIQQLSSIVHAPGEADPIVGHQATLELPLLDDLTTESVNVITPQTQSASDAHGHVAAFSNLTAHSDRISFHGNTPLTGATASASESSRPRATNGYELETVRLDALQVDELFQIFFDHYHPFLPFLDPLQSPDEYMNSSATLFWALISVASRKYQEDVTLLTALSTYVTKMIWADVSRPPYTLATVQAIILICMWPFSTTSTWSEPAVTLSSAAINVAMQVGLHRPIHTQDFSQSKMTIKDSDLRARISTWSAANMVSQMLGTVAGQLPTAPFDSTVDQACLLGGPHSLLQDLRIKLIISRFCDMVTRTACKHSDESISFPSRSDGTPFMTAWDNEMTILEAGFESLEAEHGPMMSPIDTIYFSAARVYVHSFYLFDSSESEFRKDGVLKAYRSACQFVSMLQEPNAEKNYLLHLPYYLIRTLLTAICVLLKVLKSSYSTEIRDYDAGKRLFNRALQAISQASIAHSDVAAKAVKLVSQMWHSAQPTRLPPQLTIKSRLGASITYDFIWSWRQTVEGATKNYTSPNSAESQAQQSPVVFQGFFEDNSMVNLEFWEMPDWHYGSGGT